MLTAILTFIFELFLFNVYSYYSNQRGAVHIFAFGLIICVTLLFASLFKNIYNLISWPGNKAEFIVGIIFSVLGLILGVWFLVIYCMAILGQENGLIF